MHTMKLRSALRACCGVVLALAAGLCAGSELSLTGQFTQGGLVQGRAAPGTAIEFDGRPVRVSKEGVFLLGFGRDAPTESRLRITHPDGQLETRVLQVTQRAYEIQRIDGLPQEKVTPSAKDLKRIREEAELTRAARTLDDPRLDFLTGFQWPAQGRISGVYGSQRILNGDPKQPHYGVDVAGPVGTPVKAPADGVVTLVHADMFYSGGTLILDHGHGLSSSFLHLHRILVKKGQRVRQGEVIAEIGATGRVSGPHLDWRINLFETRLDPALVAGPMAP